MTNKLILGVTGTRNGMTKQQKIVLETFIEKLLFEKEYTERIIHHGQCVGVDVQVASLLKNKYNFKVISHPPINKSLLGISQNDEENTPKNYFSRNRDIVHDCDILLVIPKEKIHQRFGGTWYTHDYCLSQNKPLFLVLP